MARKRRNRRDKRDVLQDLDPYYGCQADASLGLDPLAVGWLQRGQNFPTGPVPDGFTGALLAFCLDRHTVCARPNTLPCPLCMQRVEPITIDDDTAHFGVAEIRVLGDDDIFAAPTLIHHYVTAHDYQPPDVFVRAVVAGPPAGSREHRALVRSLNAAD
ncbi:MAG TPA: hypothetical protein VK879_06225 [Candidatus Sulfomarinibacteraceae bacterium]|nr:hypothetical protein [Candidatus Sulfomarinibacteraceae bacterium]